MCGRFARYIPKRQIAEEFDLGGEIEGLFDLPPRYNIAPTQQVAVVGQTVEGKRKIAMLRPGKMIGYSKLYNGATQLTLTRYVNSRSSQSPSWLQKSEHPLYCNPNCAFWINLPFWNMAFMFPPPSPCHMYMTV